MYGSLFVYSGLVLALAGIVNVARPLRFLCIRSRRQGLVLTGAGMMLTGAGLLAPAVESRAARTMTRLDAFVPVWQFHEVHTRRISAPPDRVFDAIKQVRADEIFLFQTLTWLRRGGRPLPRTILDAGRDEPLIDVAIRGGFVCLADDPPRELVIGTVVIAPASHRGEIGAKARPRLTPDVFQRSLPPGFALATMNFVVTPDGAEASIVSTETRVFANSPEARRRFAAYWRVIYPGSALIRRMWLRAIERRAIT